MVLVKTVGIARTKDKYLRRVRVAGPDYEAGIKAPKISWEAAAVAAKGTFRTAITAPEIPDLFEKGIKRAGDAKWSKMAIDKGIARFAPGVELSVPYYEERMTDILAVIEKTDVPVRGPRGADINWERSKKIGKALAAWRLAVRAV